MLLLDELEIGNWLLYILNGNYCTLKSKQGNILEVQGLLDVHMCYIDELMPIKVSIQMPSLFGFKQASDHFYKIIDPQLTLYLLLRTGGAILSANKEKEYPVKFVHQFQNVYFRITGEKKQPNLYGVKE